jgi:5-formyltetrahydrofolate cyclo-ligase
MKETLRKELKEKRDFLSANERTSKSKIIIDKLLSSKEYKNSRVVMTYVSFGSEVETLNLIKKSLLLGKKVVVPYMDEEEMKISYLNDVSNLKETSSNILEPVKILQASKEELDLIIVPGLVFDKKGNRIGFGKGCFDKFLKEVSAKKIALTYDFQIKEKVPAMEYDVPMNIMISEKKVIKCTN